MNKMTPRALSTRARALSADVDTARHELGKLALQARREGVANYLAIIGKACRRQESTVSHWARTQEWVESVTVAHGTLPIVSLAYSFFEKCAQMSDRLEDDVLVESLWVWDAEAGATLESFRAHLDTLAGAGDSAEISKYLARTSAGLRRKANDFGLPARVRDGMLMAADTLDDVAKDEQVTA